MGKQVANNLQYLTHAEHKQVANNLQHLTHAEHNLNECAIESSYPFNELKKELQSAPNAHHICFKANCPYHKPQGTIAVLFRTFLESQVSDDDDVVSELSVADLCSLRFLFNQAFEDHDPALFDQRNGVTIVAGCDSIPDNLLKASESASIVDCYARVLYSGKSYKVPTVDENYAETLFPVRVGGRIVYCPLSVVNFFQRWLMGDRSANNLTYAQLSGMNEADKLVFNSSLFYSGITFQKLETQKQHTKKRAHEAAEEPRDVRVPLLSKSVMDGFQPKQLNAGAFRTGEPKRVVAEAFDINDPNTELDHRKNVHAEFAELFENFDSTVTRDPRALLHQSYSVDAASLAIMNPGALANIYRKDNPLLRGWRQEVLEAVTEFKAMPRGAAKFDRGEEIFLDAVPFRPFKKLSEKTAISALEFHPFPAHVQRHTAYFWVMVFVEGQPLQLLVVANVTKDRDGVRSFLAPGDDGWQFDTDNAYFFLMGNLLTKAAHRVVPPVREYKRATNGLEFTPKTYATLNWDYLLGFSLAKMNSASRSAAKRCNSNEWVVYLAKLSGRLPPSLAQKNDAILCCKTLLSSTLADICSVLRREDKPKSNLPCHKMLLALTTQPCKQHGASLLLEEMRVDREEQEVYCFSKSSVDIYNLLKAMDTKLETMRIQNSTQLAHRTQGMRILEDIRNGNAQNAMSTFKKTIGNIFTPECCEEISTMFSNGGGLARKMLAGTYETGGGSGAGRDNAGGAARKTLAGGGSGGELIRRRQSVEPVEEDSPVVKKARRTVNTVTATKKPVKKRAVNAKQRGKATGKKPATPLKKQASRGYERQAKKPPTAFGHGEEDDEDDDQYSDEDDEEYRDEGDDEDEDEVPTKQVAAAPRRAPRRASRKPKEAPKGNLDTDNSDDSDGEEDQRADEQSDEDPPSEPESNDGNDDGNDYRNDDRRNNWNRSDDEDIDSDADPFDTPGCGAPKTTWAHHDKNNVVDGAAPPGAEADDTAVDDDAPRVTEADDAPPDDAPPDDAPPDDAGMDDAPAVLEEGGQPTKSPEYYSESEGEEV